MSIRVQVYMYQFHSYTNQVFWQLSRLLKIKMTKYSILQLRQGWGKWPCTLFWLKLIYNAKSSKIHCLPHAELFRFFQTTVFKRMKPGKPDISRSAEKFCGVCSGTKCGPAFGLWRRLHFSRGSLREEAVGFGISRGHCICVIHSRNKYALSNLSKSPTCVSPLLMFFYRVCSF